jgi:hypothetical protein
MHNQKGFSHPLLLLLLLLVVVAVGVTGWKVFSKEEAKKTTTTDSQQTPAVPKEEKPRLKNFGLSTIGPYSAETGMSGDIPITADALREYDTKGLKGFYVFGEKLEGNRKNPNFEFASLKPNTPIVASIDGIITNVRQQEESGDYEVFLQPTTGSGWTVGYDHLIDVSVSKGDLIRVGDRLGSAAIQGNGQGRFEIQVNYDLNGQTTHYCPASLIDPSVKETLRPAVTALQDAWESFSGKNLYDQAKQKIPGCLSETMTPAQAEGR